MTTIILLINLQESLLNSLRVQVQRSNLDKIKALKEKQWIAKPWLQWLGDLIQLLEQLKPQAIIQSKKCIKKKTLVIFQILKHDLSSLCCVLRSKKMQIKN